MRSERFLATPGKPVVVGAGMQGDRASLVFSSPGAKLYARLPNGRMPAPPHDESGHTWHHPDAGKLSDDEIWAVLAFIKSHWRSRELRDARAEMLRNLEKR